MFNLIFENTLRVYIGFVKTLDKWRMKRYMNTRECIQKFK